MSWLAPGVIPHFFDDDAAFMERYASAVTLARLAGSEVALARDVLRRVARILPYAAHASPTWSSGPQCVVAIGRPSLRTKPGEEGRVAVTLKAPYVGLCKGDDGTLFLWADSRTAKASGSSCWAAWRASRDGKGGRLRFLHPLTPEGAPHDPLASGRPLDGMLRHLAARMGPVPSREDATEAAEDAWDDLRSENGGERPPVIWPKLAARLSGRPEDEGVTDAPASRPACPPHRGPARGTPSAPSPVALRDLREHRFRLREVVTAHLAGGARFADLPFLDVRFAASRDAPPESLRGPGLYGIFFGEPGHRPRVLTYVGSYRGRRGAPYGGNVAEDRWWTHAASLTMRGDRISVARRTARWARKLDPDDPFRSLGSQDGMLVDRGCCAGFRRVLFAHPHRQRFAAAGPEELLSLFEVVYLRLLPPGANGHAERTDPAELGRRILLAETRLIGSLRPPCNYQISPGTARDDVTPCTFSAAASAAAA